MPVNRAFILDALRRIAYEERDVILRELASVDTLFSLGQRMNSPGWRMERQTKAVEGVKRAGERLKAEVRGLAGAEAPSFAEEVGALVGDVTTPIVASQWDIPINGPAEVTFPSQSLAEALYKVRTAVVDDLAHPPVQSTPAPGSLAGRDINIINPAAPFAIAGRDAHQHVEGFDAAGLLDVLAKVKDMVEASQATANQRERLSDDLATFEVMAQQQKPDVGRLGRMAKRLVGVLKDVAIPAAAGLLEAYAKQHLGLP
jgi:hypothetical protein